MFDATGKWVKPTNKQKEDNRLQFVKDIEKKTKIELLEKVKNEWNLALKSNDRVLLFDTWLEQELKEVRK